MEVECFGKEISVFEGYRRSGYEQQSSSSQSLTAALLSPFFFSFFSLPKL
jgi:hypothetical protein